MGPMGLWGPGAQKKNVVEIPKVCGSAPALSRVFDLFLADVLAFFVFFRGLVIFCFTDFYDFLGAGAARFSHPY